MKKSSLMVLVIMLSACSSAPKNYVTPASYETPYSYRTDTPDPKVGTIPGDIEALRADNPAEYVKQIAAYITENSQNDFERVKKAHDLITLMIHYDAENFWAKTIPDQRYQNVLKTQSAVSEGYANLFKKLCDELTIPCYIVRGFGRGFEVSPFAGDTPAKSNHAWNIVTIGDDNYLIDCTWDSGYMDGKAAKHEYTTDYLFLKPDQFLYTHYPEKPEQQLLARPRSADEFLKLPFYKPKFFEIVEKIDQNLSAINPADGTLVLDYAVKNGFSISYTVYDETGNRQFPNSAFAQHSGEKNKAYFSFPNSGNYLVRIFWKKADAIADGTTGASCGEFGIRSSSGSAVQYPAQFVSSGKNVEIISPVEMPLEQSKPYTFKVRVDNKNVVVVVYGTGFLLLKKGSDGIFSGELEIPADIENLTIGIADSAPAQGQFEYERIAQYRVN
ncbi:hypothetical protein AGMMS49991_03280 [Spirochaetia bacterium]|nr:hypothetical protein AGMMS49991_03280 [Spirochaetia bacterium]